MEKLERVYWIDAARVFAILLVILVHATESIYKMNSDYLNQIGSLSSLFAITGFTLGRLGVPIFLFITGYLLLDRMFSEKDYNNFIRKNWLNLLITTEIWIILYNIFLSIFNNQAMNLIKLLTDMLFITKVNMGHMWYMPMIIGLYLFIPIVARGISQINIKTLYFPLLFVTIYAFSIPVLRLVGLLFDIQKLTPVLDLGYSGGLYGIYIILGYCIKRGLLKTFSDRKVETLILIFFVLTIASQFLAFKLGITYKVWYNFLPLMLTALFIFEYFARIYIRNNRIVNWIARNSFGIYLVHFPFIMIFRAILREIPIMLPIKVILLWGISLLISLSICYIITKNHRLSNLLLYNR